MFLREDASINDLKPPMLRMTFTIFTLPKLEKLRPPKRAPRAPSVKVMDKNSPPWRAGYNVAGLRLDQSRNLKDGLINRFESYIDVGFKTRNFTIAYGCLW